MYLSRILIYRKVVFGVDNANSILLNRFFTRNTFKQVIDDGESSAYAAAIRRYIVDPANKKNDECISEIYHYLKK